MVNIIPSGLQPIFNAFDDKGLLVGLDRKEGESNVDYHNRIVNRVDGNSTKEGISDWILDAFDVGTVYPSGIISDITDSFVFFSTYQPLSFSKYQELNITTPAYVYPTVYDFESDTTYTLAFDDAVKDISPGGEWSLYKLVTGEYSTIWVGSYAADEIQLNYLTILDDEVIEVEESPRRPE